MHLKTTAKQPLNTAVGRPIEKTKKPGVQLAPRFARGGLLWAAIKGFDHDDPSFSPKIIFNLGTLSLPPSFSI